MIAPPLPGTIERPNDEAAERALLGAYLIDPQAFIEHPADSSWFYVTRHGWICEAVAALVGRRDNIDMITLSDELEKNSRLGEIGGPAYLVHLLNSAMGINTREYRALVHEAWLKRELLAYAEHVAVSAWSPSMTSSEIEVQASERLADIIAEGTDKSHVITARQAADAIWQQGEEYMRNPLVRGQVRHIDTGFVDLNAALGGWRPGTLAVVFAVPSAGKTFFNLHTAVAAASTGKRVLIFSMEMSARYLMLRLALSKARALVHEYERGQLVGDQLAKFYDACGMYADLPIVFNDTASRIEEIAAVISSEHLRHPLSLIIIENLSLIEGVEASNRPEAYGSLTRSLKILAGSLNVAIIVSHHISDKLLAARGSKTPEAGDVFGSSEINQKVDLLLGVSRPEVTILRLHILKDKVGGRAGSFVDLFFDHYGALHDAETGASSSEIHFD